ncbi:beta-1,3-galactosyltransferase 1 isoform X2 [Mus musculus]|uniref:beta-1,3-galactosyltransferase 1 isoform X2 n=1 Tax=Mus musculus TaxID=10090 RepID=UPI00167858BB|nr:beta-1,3-galactosyltransferase 1 isoform X2 [Mus musculus]
MSKAHSHFILPTGLLSKSSGCLVPLKDPGERKEEMGFHGPINDTHHRISPARRKHRFNPSCREDLTSVMSLLPKISDSAIWCASAFGVSLSNLYRPMETKQDAL